MTNPKDILVVTTSSIEGVQIKKYLKPVSAHVVAGTNFFSDFLGGLTDVFGGRSSTYQRQLSSLYNEAIDRIKHNAHEIGGNCIIGLSVDMDEISGKGKSMFMLTAIGTAVVIEKDEKTSLNFNSREKFENVSFERLNNLRKRKEVVDRAKNGKLVFDDEVWNFITANQVHEIFSDILLKYNDIIVNWQSYEETFEKFNKNFVIYVDSFDENQKMDILYDRIATETNIHIAIYLSNIVKELNLFDAERTMKLLQNSDFKKQKIGVRISTYDKSFYDKKDIVDLQKIKTVIADFKERGTLTTKKQLLSSKEKEVWNCECGNNGNEIGGYCGSCENDIFGFKLTEVNSIKVIAFIQQKIQLIEESLK